MPRAQLEELQLERLLASDSARVRTLGARARDVGRRPSVKPADIRSLDDFREKVPFIDKDAVRRFRDERGDPFGGLLCVPPDQLTGRELDVGNDGRSDARARAVGRRGPGSAVDHHARLVGLGRAARRLHRARSCSRSAGRRTGCSRARSARRRSSSTSIPPRWSGSASCRSSTGRPRSTTSTSVLINAVKDVCDRRGFDPHDVFASYKGVTFAGEPLSPRARDLAEELGHRAVRARQRRRRHRLVRVHRPRRLALLGGHGVRRRRRSPTAIAASSSRRRSQNTIAPLIRYRSDDIVRLSTEPCCVRSHARAHVADRAARATRSSSTAGRCCPIDVWEAVETVDACALGLFQVIRTGPRGRRLRLRVGYAPEWEPRARDRCATTCAAAVLRRGRTSNPTSSSFPTTRCCGSVRRTRSRGWRADEPRSWGDRHLRRRRRPPGAVADLARRDRPRHRRRDDRARRARPRGQARAVVLDACRGGPVLAVRAAAPCSPARRLSCADATVGEAVRVAMFLRLMPYDAVFGVTDANSRRSRRDGARRTRDVFAGVRVLAAHPGAYERLIARGLHADALRVVRPRDRDRPRAGRSRVRSRATSGSSASDAGRIVDHRARDRARRSSRVRPSAYAAHDRRRRSHMVKRPLISADNHVFEPVTLWQERLPAAVPVARAARRATATSGS